MAGNFVRAQSVEPALEDGEEGVSAAGEMNWWWDFGIDPTDPADWPLMCLIAQEFSHG